MSNAALAFRHPNCCDECYDRISAYDDLVNRLGDWAVYADDLQRQVDDRDDAVNALDRLLRFTHTLTAADHGLALDLGADIGDLHFAESVLRRLRDEVPA